METFTMILWAEPREEDFDKTVNTVYEILKELNEYGSEIAPNFMTAKRKRDAVPFNLNKQSISEILKKRTNKERGIEFPDLGCTISFFSSMHNDESCNIRMKIGVSNQRFKNTLVIHLSPYFSGYNHRILEFEELFKNCIKILDPFWACVSNDQNIEMYGDNYWVHDKPSTIHWLNYFNKDVSDKLEVEKVIVTKDICAEKFLKGYIIKLQKEIISVENKMHIEKQREVNQYFNLM